MRGEDVDCSCWQQFYGQWSIRHNKNEASDLFIPICNVGPSFLDVPTWNLTRKHSWTIAHLMPSYKHVVTNLAKQEYNAAIEHLPAVKVDWHPTYDPKTQFNASKVALLIEGRPLPHLVPQMLHMISVVPPDWRFMFIGTNKSVISVSRSFATQYQEANGKLDLVVLPKPWKIDSKEDIYRLLTDIRFYDQFLPEVEWLLKFESDSIMCARSDDSLDDWLSYSWAGAPR